MPSSIDATKPIDGLPAQKADLRANLAAAKAEIEHGGFAEGMTPVNYGPPTSSAVLDHLVAIDAALSSLGGSLPPGGTTGQVLAKQSDADGDANWEDQTAGGSASGTTYVQGGTGAVTRTVQSRLRETFYVRDFGAVADGIADDTAAFQACIDAASAVDLDHPNTNDSEQSLSGTSARVAGATVVLPAGFMRCLNVTVERTLRIVGSGRATRIGPAPGAGTNDWVLTVRRPTQNQYRNHGNHHPGVILADFMIDGVDRSTACGGLRLMGLDRSHIIGLTIEEFQGPGLQCAWSVRESTFTNIRMKYCGDANRPMLDLFDQDATVDAHNNLIFQGCGFVYPIGDTVRIGGNTANSSHPRNIIFINCAPIHGAAGNPQGPHSVAGTTCHFRVTKVQDLHIIGCRLLAWHTNQACILMDHEPGEDPSNGARAQTAIIANNNFGRPFNLNMGSFDPDASSPHIRTNCSCTVVEAANLYDGSTDAVIDKVGGLGTIRRWLYQNV